MKLRALLITGSVILVMAGVIVWMLFHEHIISFSQEVLVSSGMTLTTQWLELKPKTPMKTAAAWSELLMEVPGLLFDQDKAGRFLLADGAPFEVEGYLTTDRGERIYLDHIGASGYQGNTYLDLSSAGLQWKKRDYLFRSVTLRSSRVLTTGKAVWVSYDPRTTKDGLPDPKLLMEPPKSGG
ncbi:MAG: hypothetical protein ABSH17_08530 [Syntrophobacteraceae bacterium]|jgi:hypothetical protein